jgi:uncharacterized protein (TIGR00297 family)
LTGRGACAASGVGTAILGGTGWRGALLLGTFFVSSSTLSRRGRASDISAKGSRRDEWQVLANGGVAAIAAASGPLLGPSARAAMAGALAAATADTWATELGSRSGAAPRLLLARRSVPAGTSGGVTLVGTWAAVAGAGVVAVTGALVAPQIGARATARMALAYAAAGVAGCVVDSLLGESVQERRYCPACAKATEARRHRCGTLTARTGGVAGIDNDVVNLACTLAGAVIAVLISPVRRGSRGAGWRASDRRCDVRSLDGL